MSFKSVLSSVPPSLPSVERGRIRMKKVTESSLDLYDFTHFLYNTKLEVKLNLRALTEFNVFYFLKIKKKCSN